MKNKLYILFVFILFSCNFNNEKRFDIDVSDINIEDIQIKRYGKALFEIDTENFKNELQLLQNDYIFFLNSDINDTLNLIQIYEYISDPVLIKIANDCNNKYAELSDIEKQLTYSLKHYKYYFPEKKIPAIFTYISGFDYNYPVQYYDSILIIALDMYLGRDYEPYKQLGLPAYKTYRMQKDFIINDCMKELAESSINSGNVGKTLLDQMINEGKKLFFLDAMQAETHDTIKIGYTSEQLKWNEENEANIWAFLIENNLLYSSDYQMISKLITDAPFTSFFSRESPARIGNWIGWQIVRDYMNNCKEITLKELMNEYDAQKILTKSKYKPKR
ncbi:MAG: hypothetical protein K8R58_08005 [Bacteroidales bacterium]|nr:hypothetical protein [Bacteroidales bacterium]